MSEIQLLRVLVLAGSLGTHELSPGEVLRRLRDVISNDRQDFGLKFCSMPMLTRNPKLEDYPL